MYNKVFSVKRALRLFLNILLKRDLVMFGIRGVLQKLIEDRKNFPGKEIGYAVTPKNSAMNLTRF